MGGSNKVLVVLSLVAVAFAIIAMGITYFSILNLVEKISGYATDIGDVNLTVASSANINFTTFVINWSTGQVNLGETHAILNTADGTVTNGNWTAVSGGLVLENLGSTNVTLDLQTGKTPTQFLGGTNPGYMWNVTSLESNSCVNDSYEEPFGDVNFTMYGVFASTSTSSTRVCQYFNFISGADTIEIDINLSVPSDSLTGALTDTITATATVI